MGGGNIKQDASYRLVSDNEKITWNNKLDSVPSATSSVEGKMKLYTKNGNNTDGTMTQKAITDYVIELGSKVRRQIIQVNCNGNDYTTVQIPEGCGFLSAFAFRTSDNNYHYITGAAQIQDTTTVFLYYDAANTGNHTVALHFLEFLK